MQIIEKKISELKPYEKNPRRNDNAVDYVAKSIEQFGFKVPIVIDNNGVVVCGHTRMKAAKKLGLKTVPCIIADDLTDEQIKAFRLADNKVSEFAEWDNRKLKKELDGIFNIDMSDFGFMNDVDDKEQDNIVGGEVKFSEVLSEENNYIILQFKTEIDWLQAQSLFDLETVKTYSTRKDGKVTDKMERKGIGRVLDGAKVLNKIYGDLSWK